MANRPSIGIIGKGNVGSNLAKGLKRAGYEVQAVGKDPARVKAIAKGSDLIILAVPHSERKNALQEMGDGGKGKVLVDVSNLLTPDNAFAGRLDRSGAEDLQGWAKDAKVVKAFNTIFAPNMASGAIQGEPLTLFVAGNDDDAKRQVRELGAAIGFDAVDAGPLENARWLETLGFLNIQLGYGQEMGTDIGFRLVHPGAKTGKAQPGRESRTEEATTGTRGR